MADAPRTTASIAWLFINVARMIVSAGKPWTDDGQTMTAHNRPIADGRV